MEPFAPSTYCMERNRPVAPLPNPGEGGPVAPGTGSDTPVIPLPNPGEGGPVAPGPGENIPVIPLPNPGEGGPVAPGPTWPDINIPVIPLPSPGEGGPVAPNRPTAQTARVRFLNASNGYRPFRVFVGNRRFAQNLGSASVTAYGRVISGYQTVTITGSDGYVYIQKALPFRAGETLTVAIISTITGLDLLPITDSCCPVSGNLSIFRMCNLAYNSNPLDLLLSDGRLVYTDVQFKEVTPFKRIRPGAYQFYLTETAAIPTPYYQDIETVSNELVLIPVPETLLSIFLTVQRNSSCTLYILSRGGSPDALQALILEDR